MALLFMDGFDAGDTSIKWSLVNSTGLSLDTDTRFSYGRSIRLGNSTTYVRKAVSASEIIVGFAIKCQSISTGDFLSIFSDGGNTVHLTVGHASGDTIDVRRGGGTIIASASGYGPSVSWDKYIEVKASIADSGGKCVVRVNGVQVIDYTGDTKNGGTSTNIEAVGFTRPANVVNVDDVYICDTTGSAPYNDFLDDVRIHTLTPDAAGATTQFTPSSGANYTTVDELPYSTADYVYGTTGQKDTYSTSNLPGGTGIIYGVQTNAVVRKTDAGNISGRPVVRAGGTDYPGTSVSVGTSDTTLSKIDQVNPVTSTAWTSGDVNGMEIGVESL